MIDLNAHFGNDNGKFVAGGSAFTHSAKDVHLDGLAPHASLQKENGQWSDAVYNLDNLPAIGYVVAWYDMLDGNEVCLLNTMYNMSI
jgi:hypothetical protein